MSAQGDRVISHDEVLELADAVAAAGGIASGIGTTSFGAQLIVEADDRDAALRHGTAEFVRAAAQAGLPAWPVTYANAISEADELGDLPFQQRVGPDRSAPGPTRAQSTAAPERSDNLE